MAKANRSWQLIMATEIRLEKISDTMESATVVRWLKQVGDQVAAGEVIVELETDKVTVELEAPRDGVIARIAAPDGSEDVPVGALLAVIESAGEAKAAALPSANANPERAPASSDARAIDISAHRIVLNSATLTIIQPKAKPTSVIRVPRSKRLTSRGPRLRWRVRWRVWPASISPRSAMKRQAPLPVRRWSERWE
jgi:pyruvate/2-oxoglutarate dehydrogenase complex dihydrolipoamide acyltransferase (E2) component